ncbi:crotonobetainyl-CoA:carnitine CoA-transferase CaiB-like acyl-CoA transferase [Cytobacillus eiseniae]|uniref:Crotonobetainyl-CoA:carnitine CoA-transferase CaiB-like acyl-CoA transferase n=1 Tax=Cytobacillus eiseniae TaxID=762947 RepID=A0ABS4R9N7_9BACI|nr:CoA transferase [Cytobacillus eiseniae]MBP2239607.1 crotonobetainyl-CoA:carnitine CoA-transferase CaiB-like acyl-CoA transferase [Cytobacillus eiseniae]
MLKGVRIIDFSNYLPGPFATMRLAELGAEVIKIEPPEGDPARNLGIKRAGTGVVFLANNRQKKSITLNLKEEGDYELAIQLISTADAVLESFRPGVMQKLGLDYETVTKYKKDIVYCSLTGYGEKGQYHSLGSHDLNYMGISGVLAQLKDETGKPIHPSIQLADYMGGMAASERILAAILSKEQTGKGGYHCISMASVIASIMGNHLLIEQETGDSSGISFLNGQIISYAIYETKDQRYVTMGALERKFWENFCHAIGKKEWTDAHFSKTENDNPIYMEMKALFKSRYLQEWVDFGTNVDCCLTPVLEVNELKHFSLFRDQESIYQSTSNGLYSVKMHGDRMGEPVPAPAKNEHGIVPRTNIQVKK